MKKSKANSIGTAVFLIGLGILFVTEWWWPGIIIVIGLPGVVTSLIKGKIRDGLITAAFFGIVFILFTYDIPLSIIIALLLIGAGIWIFINNSKK